MQSFFLTAGQPRRARARWQLAPARRRAWAGWLTLLAFAFLLAALVSHRHHGNVERHQCVVCSAAADTLAAPPAAPVAAPQPMLLPYRLAAAAPDGCRRRAPRLLPPSCGPPAVA